MVRFTAYMILMFSMALAFYYLGYTSVLGNIYSNQGSNFFDPGALITQIAQLIVSDTQVQILLGMSVLFGLAATFLGGFGSMFIIPLIMLTAVLNFFIFPLSYIFDASLPNEIKIPITIFFNLLTISMIMSWGRGGG